MVLRGLAMLGDGLAHISFAGVALGLFAGVWPLGIGILVAIAGALVIQWLRTAGIVTSDTAVGILFTAGLAAGVLIVSAGPGFSVDIMSILFGNILGVTPRALVLLAVLAGVLLVTLVLLYKEFLFVTFNEESARLAGLPVGVLNVVFMACTAASIVVATQVVGILLVSALVVVPAATALQGAKDFRGALLRSVGAGWLSVIIGLLVATEYGLASGGSIAAVSTLLFIASVAVRGRVARS